MKRKIAVLDLETDPFEHGAELSVFAVGIYSSEFYREFWGDDAVVHAMEFLHSLEDEYLIYAHNGGKFDFFFLIDWLENPLKIINGRIVSAKLRHHQLRDSYAIIPVALAQYQKTKIDYTKFKTDKRQKYKAEILRYLYDDCRYLFDLVHAFVLRFGPRLTIGSTAIKEIAKKHPFKRMKGEHDTLFRQYYYGGRCEVFLPGVMRGAWKIYDVNSMYPFVMRDFDHCNGTCYYHVDDPPLDVLDALGRFDRAPALPYFALIDAASVGALPARAEDRSLSFPEKHGTFFATSHEIQVGLKHRLLDIKKIQTLYVSMTPINFTRFVDCYSTEKIEAKKSGDKVNELFAKFLLNSGYGKFAQNPANFCDWKLRNANDWLPEKPWELYSMYGEIEVWKRAQPAEFWSYYDVATAASITGAARACLLDAIPHAQRLAYCDTDSVICEGLHDVEIDETKLGAWKLEAEGDELAIAGKKLYSLTRGGEKIKLASKGVKAKVSDIKKICGGEIIEYNKDAPSFSLAYGPRYVTRKIKSTVGEK